MASKKSEEPKAPKPENETATGTETRVDNRVDPHSLAQSEAEFEELPITRAELEEVYLAPLLERIQRLEEASRIGPPAPVPADVEVRIRDGRRRHIAPGITVVGPDWQTVRPRSREHLEALRADPVLEVRGLR